ncbi:MAG: polymer-forming cytoskeletal protein [Bacteroidales bacterium]|nr:polymer-forming cytoskeletal protein [Bacteroidales bacterium]
MAKNNFTESKPNTIVSGTHINGEVKAEGDFRIDGTLKGSINCKGKIVIGQSGSVEGEIICQNADFSGNIKAQVTVEQLLTLKATAQLHGDVTTGKLSIEPGAKFTGSCNMEGGSVIKPNPPKPNESKGPEEKQLK